MGHPAFVYNQRPVTVRSKKVPSGAKALTAVPQGGPAEAVPWYKANLTPAERELQIPSARGTIFITLDGLRAHALVLLIGANLFAPLIVFAVG
jgi:hypothetical protein